MTFNWIFVLLSSNNQIQLNFPAGTINNSLCKHKNSFNLKILAQLAHSDEIVVCTSLNVHCRCRNLNWKFSYFSVLKHFAMTYKVPWRFYLYVFHFLRIKLIANYQKAQKISNWNMQLQVIFSILVYRFCWVQFTSFCFDLS
jgi:hypothetical protein